LLEADAKKAEKLLEELKEETTSLNRDRKNTQVRRLYDNVSEVC
jgi:pre-mRNA-splicing factor SPF27